jgi:hypothetical protein
LLWIGLGALFILGCSQTPATLELRVAPNTIDGLGRAAGVTAIATDPQGRVGKGRVRFTAAVGELSQTEVDLDAYGTARVTFLCLTEKDPSCTGTLPVTATWESTSGSLSEEVRIVVAASAWVHCTTLPGSSSCDCEPGYAEHDGRCVDVAASLSGLRWNIPCVQIGPTACTCVDPPSVSSRLSGTPGSMYDVTLRFRGVVEEKTYTGGTNDGAWWQIGGVAPNDGYNIYRLDFSSPAQTFYLNRGTSAISRAWAIDYTKTIRAAAGAVVSLSAHAGDGLEILNRDSADSSGSPIVVPGVPPAPEAFNGQFVQMDVVEVVLVP